MPNTELTHVFVLLDGSGSMTSMKQAVIDGFNEFVLDQNNLPGNVTMSMVQFNSKWNGKLVYKVIHHFTNLKELKKLTLTDYNPAGGTPLLAAMSQAIDELGEDLFSMPENERPGKVLFMTVTDGEENTSDKTKFSKELISTKIRHQTNHYNWQFLYIGANQDAFHEAGGIGINKYNTANFSNTYKGMTTAISAMSLSTTAYRSTGTIKCSLTDTLTSIEKEESKTSG